MGKKDKSRQEDFWIATQDLARSPGHPFYEKLNAVFDKHNFDEFTEKLCSKFYAEKMGRPSIPPGVYFRMLLSGYFERLDSERGIAWRYADSLALRRFIGYSLDKKTPDHSTVSRTRRLLDIETHCEVFKWILKVLAKEGLVTGKTLGVDATTLEANAALRSIVRRDTGEGYREFLERLAKSSGIETPTREDLAKLDRKRKNKGSNKDWEHPHDPDARIGKMKDGSTHLSYKAEHAVDFDSGAVLGFTLSDADEGDTDTLPWTLLNVERNIEALLEDEEVADAVTKRPLAEVVTDKGYHSNDSLVYLEVTGSRTYVSEPDRGKRRWDGKEEARKSVYSNRRRIRGNRGKRLLRKRGEFVERAFEHYLDRGGMRRLHLRGRGNILKRMLVHVGGFDLGLVMRKILGFGTPRGLAGSLSSGFKGILSSAFQIVNNEAQIMARSAGKLITALTTAKSCRILKRGV